jgi:curli biogenesis system outer membrane secretion channel CsgG
MKNIRKLIISIFVIAFVLGITGVVFAGGEGTTSDEEDATVTEITINSPETGDATVDTEAEADDEAIEGSGRPRLAVHTFENPPNYYNSTIGNGLTSILITHLTQSGRFDVIQRGENLELIIDEISLGQSGYIEGGTEVEMGHVLGVDFILSGRVTNFGYEEQSTGGLLRGIGGFGGLEISKDEANVRVDFSLIDATTGTTVLAATAEGKESETGVSISGGDFGNWIGAVGWDTDEFMDSMIGHATLRAIDSMIGQILEEFPIQAPIQAVTPNFLILGIGSGAGIEEGMEFDVFRITAITNDEGEIVWEERTPIGRVQISDVELQNCKAIILSGSGFQEGDLCILPEETE